MRHQLTVLKKYELEAEKEKLTLVSIGKHLAWGITECGLGRKFPYWLKSFVLTIWNRIACISTGHDTTEIQLMNDPRIDWPEDAIPECCNCGAQIKEK